MTVGIIWEPPNQVRFLEILSGSLNTLNLLNGQWHILVDLNIDISKNCIMFTQKNKNITKSTNKHLKLKNIGRNFAKCLSLNE